MRRVRSPIGSITEKYRQEPDIKPRFRSIFFCYTGDPDVIPDHYLIIILLSWNNVEQILVALLI